MGDSLYELLVPHLDKFEGALVAENAATPQYLNRLSSLSVSSLTSTEPESLAHDSQSLLRSLQALSKRSYKSINTSVNYLAHLREALPELSLNVECLHSVLPNLEADALSFSQKYNRSTENTLLDRRKKAMHLGENIERLSDILELPALLSSIIAASSNNSTSTNTTSGGAATSSANANYASAMDLYAHIKRLQRLYPDSELIRSISFQAEDALRGMTTTLILSLRSQSLKLAGAMRLIGLLRRVAPELDENQNATRSWTSGTSEGSFGAMFLVCRLSNLMSTLEALEPLKELADQESVQKLTNPGRPEARNAISVGQQTERYLKRYIETFREQCFAIISMYKSIFPASLQDSSTGGSSRDDLSVNGQSPLSHTMLGQQKSEAALSSDPMQNLPSSLSTFTFHLVDTLMETLKTYLPNVRDQTSRDSLLTQVLYCASSLGRLGGDFGMMLSMLDNESEEHGAGLENTVVQGEDIPNPEWIEVTKKHRIQTGRLEILASGAGVYRLLSMPTREVVSPR